MTYFQNIVTDDIFKWLFNNKFPVAKCFYNHSKEQLYYTLPRTDPNWADCDAYYKPTYFDVLHWLFTEYNLYININFYTNFSVQITNLSNKSKNKYFGNCWEIGANCKTLEDCIESAIKYIIKEDVLNKLKS